MNKPLLRAEGIIVNEDKTKILVQCDLEESFYRLPGGSIEFGETAVEAIKRELIEEFDLHSDIGELACINENIVQYDGKKRHDCTLIHWCSSNNKIDNELIHNEKSDIKLIWRTIPQLGDRRFYPEGILNVITSNKKDISHLKVEKNYD
ncbi:NUDIX domain-containing protein [Gracilibacillus caseinilyticus]|uniref:NUDIX domain-containing protein n=1 Tax=Gracilibacillus caseinilyticus TaxID=2932256 RepID=A0ABY4F2B7_9BACI|nr:NUDIX domain-containing protein [Gracilibacillus caseinilyticus]UOQ50360.1 NUDIX domain-containing protein [Gracilibacillus caseinilyticus]